MEPTFVPRERIEQARGRVLDAAAQGLWSCGALEILARPCVAIVGTRAATPYGRRLARVFAQRLGAGGCCIVSGLALGIDAAAHEGALEARAATAGVLGGGHRHFFPARNAGLAGRMLAAGGAVLSPYAPDQPAKPGQFLQRNGIVAALADAVVVIEAPARSGALNTAGWAAGRIPVLAVPGDVDRPHVQGCLALIRDGALLARSPEDVFEALGSTGMPLNAPPELPRCDPRETAVLAALEAGEARLDDVAAATGISASTLLSILTALELDGAIEARAGSTYARAPSRALLLR